MDTFPTARVAIVTGAAQGIGRAIALHLIADGINVAVNDIASKSGLLDDLVKEIEQVGEGRKGLAVPCDVSKENEVSAMVQKVVEQLGRLDIVSRSCSVFLYMPPLTYAQDDRQCRDWVPRILNDR